MEDKNKVFAKGYAFFDAQDWDSMELEQNEDGEVYLKNAEDCMLWAGSMGFASAEQWEADSGYSVDDLLDCAGSWATYAGGRLYNRTT